ncbi:MAG: 2-hydroxy-6-oxo-octa-2,4-dienoate hydrolase [Actinomycetota bacterium]|jgi:pimeloyl-ACP methyl ester carboxylesterase|nr:2-hydroxy-6-oxo-octa-2,4-dienoate hydrolase [Actinomycetota bacterium]
MTEGGGRPELGSFIDAGGIKTNYLDVGQGWPVVLVHGSGPGVSAYANWRLTLPALAPQLRAIAPDMVGFGFTDRPADIVYGMETWVRQLLAFLDALELERVSIVGNSFGGALALRVAADHPERVERLVLMGSAGLSWSMTDGLEAVWGYQPSVENMRRLLDLFAYDRSLVTDELAEVRYRASIEPGVQEAFAAMFPPPRQRWLESLATPEDRIASLVHPTLVVHGRDDRVVPLESSLRLARLIEPADLVVFGRCGHWTQIERAAEFNALLARFLTAAPEPAR